MKRIIKITIDVAMTILFLILMAYHITGNSLHEWLGVTLFLFFIVHHVLNLNWYKGLFRGRYTTLRIFMLAVNFLLLVDMVGMMVSGIMLSREVFGFLNLRAGMFGRKLHMVSTALGFCLMAVHIGIHWGMVIGMTKKFTVGRKWMEILNRIIAISLAAYGVYAFISRQIGERMLLLMEYAYFDYREPGIFFFIDYICILRLFAEISYYLTKLLRKKKGA